MQPLDHCDPWVQMDHNSVESQISPDLDVSYAIGTTQNHN